MKTIWFDQNPLQRDIAVGDDIVTINNHLYLKELYQEYIRRGFGDEVVELQKLRSISCLSVDTIPDFTDIVRRAFYKNIETVKAGRLAFLNNHPDENILWQAVAITRALEETKWENPPKGLWSEKHKELRENAKATGTVLTFSDCLAHGGFNCAVASLYGQLAGQYLNLDTTIASGWYRTSENGNTSCGPHAWNVLTTPTSRYIVDYINGDVRDECCPAIFVVDHQQWQTWAEVAAINSALMEVQHLNPKFGTDVCYFGSIDTNKLDSPEQDIDPVAAGIPIIRAGGSTLNL